MADRNAIIEKIKALLAKTTANGCTEAEMMAALDKAAALKDAYDIPDEELQLAKEEAAMLHAEPPDQKDPHGIKWRLSYAVGQFCNVRIYRSRRETGLSYIGMPSDTQLAASRLCFRRTLRASHRLPGVAERSARRDPLIRRRLLHAHH
jgi:Protein of unknown function (DUF2786)